MGGVVSSEVEMANLAVGLLKEPFIGSFDAPTTTARWFKQFYKPSRLAVLERHPWNFAAARISLGATGTKPAFDWQYEYMLPIDCLYYQPPRVMGARTGALVPHVPEGRSILTDYPAPLNLRYTVDVTDETLFSGLFAEAFSLYMAAKLSQTLTGKASLSTNLGRLFEDAIDQAKARDAMQGTPDESVQSENIGVRSQEASY